jgi:tartrate-resistant acid phosphatase type 5
MRLGSRLACLAFIAFLLPAGCLTKRDRDPGGGLRPGAVPRGEPDCFGRGDAAVPLARFAVIGDFGLAGPGEAAVAALVGRFKPDFIITVGDNNYPDGAAETIDVNIGQYFHDFIAPYTGQFGAGAAENLFFPSLGNHDWRTAGAGPYLDYFTLPGNERYYDFARGNVHLFAVDSDPSEPDGITDESVQGHWLRAALAAATEPWRIVYMHHPPYSSGPHGSTSYMQWPFGAWGATVVFAGHDHDYERLEVEGITYVVCGLGGAPAYHFGSPLPGTRSRFEGGFGAGLVEATAEHLRLRFYTADGVLIDQACLGTPP